MSFNAYNVIHVGKHLYRSETYNTRSEYCQDSNYCKAETKVAFELQQFYCSLQTQVYTHENIRMVNTIQISFDGGFLVTCAAHTRSS